MYHQAKRHQTARGGGYDACGDDAMTQREVDQTRGLNHPDAAKRLENLAALCDEMRAKRMPEPQKGIDVNNHIHTTFSFSPYSPTCAVWRAYTAGLQTAGIMDHDSIAGAREFIEAGRTVGLATTIGVECRVDFSDTPLCGRSINNPDQRSIGYVALHGVPHSQIDRVQAYFAPYTMERHLRNRTMVARINELTSGIGVSLDYDQDVLPISESVHGGSVTERHILFALSVELIRRYGKGKTLVDAVRAALGVAIRPKVETLLLDPDNPYYEYDLLGALKSDLVQAFYVDATDECPSVQEIASFSKEIGAILAYAYLGDVEESVTGDKKAQKFEDDYIEELFEVIKSVGFNAVTYMPTRNSIEQLRRVKALCERHGLFQISGEDINSPRQSFVCEALRNPEFHSLIDSTWALIGHERAATDDLSKGMFTPETAKHWPDLTERIRVFKSIGLGVQVL
jgi:hypothetical protein